MEQALFKKFCHIAYTKAGITLNDSKQSLVSARVAKRLRALGIDGPQRYLGYLEKDESGEELVQFLDAISTNFTSFYRETDHFQFLGQEVKRWVDAGARKLRFWSAASSTGEEPYTMAITILEALKGADVDFKILATDISTKVLAQTQAGIYSAERLEPVSRQQKCKYFTRIGRRGEEGECFAVKPEVKSHLVIKRLNLSTPPFPMQGPLNAVFCRNVMIYFDRAVRQGLVSEIERLLAPDGFVAIGHSETLSGLHARLKPVQAAVYHRATSSTTTREAL